MALKLLAGLFVFQYVRADMRSNVFGAVVARSGQVRQRTVGWSASFSCQCNTGCRRLLPGGSRLHTKLHAMLCVVQG